MTLVVMGATGKLGRVAVRSLIDRGIAPNEIVAVGRNESALQELADQGTTVARVDYSDTEGLRRALDGATAALLISGNEMGVRVEQHRNVIEASVAAGVGNLVYTSVPNARETSLFLAPDHKVTEEIIEKSGISATILRNNFYAEGFQADFTRARDTGLLANSAGEGRVATAPRAEFAEAAAVALAGREWDGKIYELGGDHAWTYAEFAATAAEVLGKPVRYQNLSPEQEAAAAHDAGVDEAIARRISVRNAGIREGAVDRITDDLSTLLGRPTTTLASTMRTWV
ncbi:NmrA family NAD(P)-binding protein [Streptomyces chartreusis]|uniref:NmrA family NAD(P)-binding protein n=1 Tax=Streptomyces chartreusis TaxID=1969 RepID=A0A7H8T1F3_STRCX|nr:NmrA family NAD(P)-binding protein [Streptomyces chartreusis]QKZ17313.1 NmrA family NAD(P)-binding protein [Streptomyces chartreusis]